ncbi:MAG: hypothetical protein ABIO86_07825 [Sphingomonas sp.]
MAHRLADERVIARLALSQDLNMISNVAGFPVPTEASLLWPMGFPVISNIFPVMEITGKVNLSI